METRLARMRQRFKRSSNPKEFGHGTWDVLHLLGADANTYAKKMRYIEEVDLITRRIECSKCRADSIQYVQDHPLTDYAHIIENGEDVGFFYWSVDFHNYVNRKLGKPEVPRDVAYKMYKPEPDNNKVCINCGDEGNVSTHNPVPPVNRRNTRPAYHGFLPVTRY